MCRLSAPKPCSACMALAMNSQLSLVSSCHVTLLGVGCGCSAGWRGWPSYLLGCLAGDLVCTLSFSFTVPQQLTDSASFHIFAQEKHPSSARLALGSVLGPHSAYIASWDLIYCIEELGRWRVGLARCPLLLQTAASGVPSWTSSISLSSSKKSFWGSPLRSLESFFSLCLQIVIDWSPSTFGQAPCCQSSW